MTSLVGTDDIRALGDIELGALLARLEHEEQVVSRRRSTLHNRIDFLRSGGFASTDPAREPLEELVAREHQLSEQRRLLHRQIDAVRSEDSRRRGQR